MQDATKHYINGQWLASIDGHEVMVENSFTEEMISTITIGNAEDPDAAVVAAQAAFADWAARLERANRHIRGLVISTNLVLKRWPKPIYGVGAQTHLRPWLFWCKRCRKNREPIIAGDARWERYTDMVNEHCIARGFSLEISQRAYLRDEMLSLVLGGMGVLIYPNCIVNAARFCLRAIPISDVGDVITTSLIWRNDSANPIVAPFVEAVRKSLTNVINTKWLSINRFWG